MRPESEKVVVGYLHPGKVDGAFMQSLIGVLFHDFATHKRIADGGGVLPYVAGCNLSAPRNELVKRFLAADVDWLWMVDTDMSFAADTLERLLEHADPVKAPIVGGLCFALNDEGNIVPTLFGLMGNDAASLEVTRYDTWPPNTMFQVEATGAACLLVHRSVFTRMTDFDHPARPGKKGFNDAYPWFQELEHNGRPVSEDIGFCWRAGLLEIPVYANTAVQLGHVKYRLLTAESYQMQRELELMAASAEVEPTAILVPVMRRPRSAAPFMASLRKTSSVPVYALADAGDDETITAWQDAGAAVMIRKYADDRGGTFAEKVNFGATQTDEPWLFLVGDDVRFRPGWLEAAQQTAQETESCVVGTNDLTNPKVMSGEKGTHLLISRDYVEKYGAGWDGPGVVCHEGYRHWYVDDEIVTAARQRGVWAFAANSIVEHLHPLWGKGDMDDVYQLGHTFAAQDEELFMDRLAANA